MISIKPALKPVNNECLECLQYYRKNYTSYTHRLEIKHVMK